MTKLLLVEDDNNLREIYEARLQAEGYTIVSAHDGEEALVVAKAEKPDLIISDVMMPKISGFEMLDILRNTDGLRDVKVIMLTALGQSDDQQRADRLGADRYLVKSQVTLEDIVKVAHDLLNESADSAAPVDPATETTTPPPELPVPTVPSPVATDPATPTTPEPSEQADTPSSVSAEPTASTDSTPSATETPPAPAEPSADTDPVTPNSTPIEVSDATSSASEEAAVEAQIEDFVAGANDIATPPPPSSNDVTSADTPAATAPTEETETDSTAEVDEPSQESTETQAADEKLVSDAADALEASTKESEDTKEKEDESNLPQQKKVGGERVIEPIESEPKKDITDLLAIEEAKEAAGAIPGATANPVIVDDKEGPQTDIAPPTTTVNPSAPPSDKVDPSNIAL